MKNTRSEKLGSKVLNRLTLGADFLEKNNQEVYFKKAQKIRRLISDYFNNILNSNDLLIFPSSPEIAPLFSDGKKNNFMSNILSAANLNGHPSISLKLSTHKNLPYGIELETKLYNDGKLLSYAL
jgi:aspartyl-tRNA(Asn)/glutamyl-tRNA(Gln) amidotransferase subunit A